jgi:head-tail adaptor
MARFPAGEYRHRLEIQKNVPTLDSSRRKVDNWQLLCVRKARRPLPPRSATVVIADANRSEISTVTFRVRSDSVTQQIDSNCQHIHLGKVYKIESASDPDGEGDEIELICRAREFDK